MQRMIAEHDDDSLIPTIDTGIKRGGYTSTSLSTDSSSTTPNHDSNVTGFLEEKKPLRLPRKSIMTVRTLADSVSNSEAVLEKRRRKQMHRHVELVQKGYFKDVSIVPLSVSFHQAVGVREYGVGIVDNPSVSGGVPIGLTGECKREYSCSIHEYGHMEDHNNLAIPPKEREIILNLQGVSWKEIHNAVQATNYAIAQRRRKKKKNWSYRLSETLENMGSSLLSTGHAMSYSQRKLMRESLECSRRTRIEYDLEEEARLSSPVDPTSCLLDPLRSMHVDEKSRDGKAPILIVG
jgi:hypothetical protein